MLTPTEHAAQKDPSAERKRKQKEYNAKYRRAAARVVELEALKEQGPLTVEQEAELAELQPKVVHRKQKKKESAAKSHRARMAAAARVAELEELKERGKLTDEQETELAELRPKVAGRDKKVREVAETGVGGAPVADRSVGPEGVSGWTGADQVDRDGWSADVDVDAWLARAVADVDGVQVPQGAANAGVMLGGGAYEEFVANELLAFLGQDAGDHAAGVGDAGSVVGGFDFAGFLSDYGEGAGSVGLFGSEGPDKLFFGELFAGDAGESGALGVSDPVTGVSRLGLDIGSCRG